jgi:anti-sigma regulatory factor (Ser/Thr protein kinase)
VQVALGAGELRRVDLVPLLLGLISQLEVTEDHAGQLFAILSEMFNNALDHGVLGLDSLLKVGPEGLAGYYEERARRLVGLAAGSVEVELRRRLLDGTPVLEIRVADSGRGFDHELAMARAIDAACLGDEQPYGRGLLLLRHLCRSVDFLQDGREVLVRYALTTPIAESATDVRAGAEGDVSLSP